MNIIILQHIKIEDPGYIKDLMIEDGFNLKTIELDEGEKIPNNIGKFDAMFCMGGPMDTYMEDQYPWLVEEKKRIKEFVVDLKKPYLGFCLGCQLLGEVIGGKVVKSNSSEIGIMEINFSNKKKMIICFLNFQIKLILYNGILMKCKELMRLKKSLCLPHLQLPNVKYSNTKIMLMAFSFT